MSRLKQFESSEMTIANWFKRKLTDESNSLTLYRRGMKKAKTKDHQGAIRDFADAFELPDTSAEVTAITKFNRALVLIANGDFDKGADELRTVINSDGVPSSVKKMAQRKLAKRTSRSRHGDA